MAAAVGWLIGSLVQFAMQLLGLREARLRLTLNWRHPAIRQIIRLYTPVMFSLILDTLVIRTFSYNLASKSIEGSTGYMNWATTLIQFPQGLVATAISIAILPTLSRQAALTTPEGRTAFRDTLGLGLRLATTLILPATVALFVLATPIIALLFEHGAFTAGDTVITALALRLYLFGLPFAALDLLLVYAFYARQDTLTPAMIGLLSLTVYMVVAVALFPMLGLFSLMIADSVKHLTHALVSAYLLARRMNGLGQQRLILTVGKAGLAAIGMGIIVAAVMPVLTRLPVTPVWLKETLLIALSGTISVLAYLGLAFGLRLAELRWLWSMFRQRVKV
jgi:putative peptidoglycan lipid II flippase